MPERVMATTENTLSERRFIIGQVPSDFDPKRDIVAGWSCFCGLEEQHPNWDALEIKEPIEDPDEVVAELRAINAYVNDLVIEWTPRWNTMHDVDRSASFWHMLSIAWMIDLTHLVRYRYLEIRKTLASHPSTKLVASAVSPDQKFEFAGYSDFAPASYANPALSNWIRSLIVHEIAHPELKISNQEQIDSAGFVASAYVPPKSSKLWGAMRSLKASLKSDRCRIGSGAREFTPWLKFSTLFAEATLSTICRFSQARQDLSYTAPVPSNGAYDDHFSDAFKRVMDRAIRGTMPTSLTTRFGSLDRQAYQNSFHPRRKRIEMSFLHLDEERKFKVAHAVENDEVLIGAQHGGNAGTAAAIQFAPESEYRYHAAITWGWKSCGGYPGNFIPLPSPQLAPWIGKHKAIDNTILVVGTGVRFIPGRFSFEGDIFNRPTSRVEKSALFDHLNAETRAKIRYRPYFGMQSTVSDATYFENKYPDIPLVKTDFFAKLMRSQLMVIDHPGTTMLQALVAGLPFVGFWSPKAFYMCPEATEKFDALRNAKVVFDSGSDAARHINEIAEDVEGWWSSNAVQDAVADVRDTYAKTSRMWLMDWARMLIKL